MSSSPHDLQDHGPRPYRYHRPQDLDPQLFVSSDEVDKSFPSPPYQRVPSTSQVLLESYPEQSPAYRSRSNTVRTDIQMSQSDDNRLDEKSPDSKGKQHAVHYTDELQRPPGARRFDSDPRTASRASSIAGTDDEDSDDDYDWSGEEDLVDEEAKFEHAMGVKKTRRFGCIKCVLHIPLSNAQLLTTVISDSCTDSSPFCSPPSSARLSSPVSSSHRPSSCTSTGTSPIPPTTASTFATTSKRGCSGPLPTSPSLGHSLSSSTSSPALCVS